MTDEEAKKRLIILTYVRLFALAVILLGMFVGYTDLIVEGGLPVVGMVIAVLGLVDLMFAPRLLMKHWKK